MQHISAREIWFDRSSDQFITHIMLISQCETWDCSGICRIMIIIHLCNQPRRSWWHWRDNWCWIMTKVSIDKCSLILWKLHLIRMSPSHRNGQLPWKWNGRWRVHLHLWSYNSLARCKNTELQQLQTDTQTCTATTKWLLTRYCAL